MDLCVTVSNLKLSKTQTALSVLVGPIDWAAHRFICEQTRLATVVWYDCQNGKLTA